MKFDQALETGIPQVTTMEAMFQQAFHLIKRLAAGTPLR